MSEASADKIIYHYCSTQSFKLIFETKSVWLTDLSQTNDAREGREISDVITEMLRDAGTDRYVITRWQEKFASSMEFFRAFGFCASEDGDLLSQWRGYADDGAGFAIGFSIDELRATTKIRNRNEQGSPIFFLEKVVYERVAQRSMLAEAVEAIRTSIANGALDHLSVGGLLSIEPDDATKKKRAAAWKSMISAHLVLVMLKRFEMKHFSFNEEKEWRLLAIQQRSDRSIVGNFRGDLGFYARKNTVIPYLRYDFPLTCIKEIVVGPRNRTPIDVLYAFLQFCGLNEISMKHSVSPYL